MGKKTIRKYIDLYVKRLQKDVALEKVIMYGSYITNNFKEKESDIDLLVISKKFKKLSEDNRLKLLYGKTVGLPIDLHIYGFTPDEIKNVSPLRSLYYALNKGVNILS